MRSVTKALALVAGLVASATALAAPDASGAAGQEGPNGQLEQTYTAEDGVVHYPFDPSRLPGYTVRALIGTRENDGSVPSPRAAPAASLRTHGRVAPS